MLLIYIPSIRGEGGVIDYDKQATWNLLHISMDTHRQRLIDEHLGNLLQTITSLQTKFSNMNFSDKSRYNRLFQKVVHKEGKSSINFIKILQILRIYIISGK